MQQGRSCIQGAHQWDRNTSGPGYGERSPITQSMGAEDGSHEGRTQVGSKGRGPARQGCPHGMPRNLQKSRRLLSRGGHLSWLSKERRSS